MIVGRLLYKLLKDVPFCLASGLLWTVFNEQFTSMHLVVGFILGYLSLFVGRLLLGFPIRMMPQGISILRLVGYMFRLIINVYIASFQCIKGIIQGKSEVKIITLKSQVDEEWKKILLTSSITLTPGSITIDTFKDRILVLVFKEDKETGIDDLEKFLLRRGDQ